jgi:hypothetical protein
MIAARQGASHAASAPLKDPVAALSFIITSTRPIERNLACKEQIPGVPLGIHRRRRH